MYSPSRPGGQISANGFRERVFGSASIAGVGRGGTPARSRENATEAIRRRSSASGSQSVRIFPVARSRRVGFEATSRDRITVGVDEKYLRRTDARRIQLPVWRLLRETIAKADRQR